MPNALCPAARASKGETRSRDAGRGRCGCSFGARMEQADAARHSRVMQDVRRRTDPGSREAARPRSCGWRAAGARLAGLRKPSVGQLLHGRPSAEGIPAPLHGVAPVLRLSCFGWILRTSARSPFNGCSARAHAARSSPRASSRRCRSVPRRRRRRWRRRGRRTGRSSRASCRGSSPRDCAAAARRRS
jgi:hypothetical protein